MSAEPQVVGLDRLDAFGIGHAQDEAGGTGISVVICEKGAVAGLEVRGGSPGTREAEGLDPAGSRSSIHAVFLAGGSAFGLDAAAGVVRGLEEKGIGRDVGLCRVPIVCGAVLFDLCCGDYHARPDAAMGYEATIRALARNPLPGRGNAGAGTGASLGKALGPSRSMKAGLGSLCLGIGELAVYALVAVNCVGDVIDPSTGRILAGTRGEAPGSFADSEACLLAALGEKKDFFSGNTIIGCIATNARLSKGEAKRLASVSHDGIARVVRPSHTRWDGDSLFALSSGEVEADPDAVALLAVRAVEGAIVDAILSAEPAYGLPSARSYRLRDET